MKWFRFYAETLDDPKVLGLSDGLFRVWIKLLCIAARHDGVLPENSHLLARLRSDRYQQYVSKLSALGFIDVSADGLRPHNWDGRQYKSDTSTERVKRFRNGPRLQTTDNTEYRVQKKLPKKRNPRRGCRFTKTGSRWCTA